MTAAGVGVPTAPPPVEPPARRRRRRWPWFLAGAIALVALVAAVLAVAYPSSHAARAWSPAPT